MYYELESIHTARIRQERLRAKQIRKTHAWVQRINTGRCEYCHKHYKPQELTMDHIIPLARGGTSTLGNLAVACKPCNASKGLHTPVDLLLGQL